MLGGDAWEGGRSRESIVQGNERVGRGELAAFHREVIVGLVEQVVPWLSERVLAVWTSAEGVVRAKALSGSDRF